MKIIFWKLIKDFRKSIEKFILFLLAASLSAWGISTVVYGYFMTERDFQENFEQTYPADIVVYIENYTDDIIKAFLSDPNVIDIERRELIQARIKNNQDSWMPFVIFAVEDVDKMRYNKFKILTEVSPSKDNLFIEQNAFSFLKENQQNIEVIFRNSGKAVTWDISGRIHDPGQAPATMEGVVYGYTTSIEKIAPYLTKKNRRLLIETNVSNSLKKLKEVNKRLEKIAESYGGKIVSSKIPKPGEHIHQAIVDGIAFLQRSGGSVISLMGIILLSLILLTWVNPQLREIGIMKAIGSSTKHIFSSYSSVLLLIIALGLSIGMPLGYSTASYYNSAVAYFQNFEVSKLGLSFHIHLIVALIGLTIPLLFAIRPLLKGSKASVNETMNKVFYVFNKRMFKLSQQLTLNPKMRYVVNNLFRQGQRTFFVILLFAIGIALFFTAINVENSIRKDLIKYDSTSPYEVVVGLPKQMKISDIEFLFEDTSFEDIVTIKTSRISYIPPKQASPESTIVRVFSSQLEIDEKYINRGEIDKNCNDCIYVCGDIMKNNFEDTPIGSSIDITYESGEIKSYKFSGAIDDLIILGSGSPFFVYDDEITQEFNTLAFKLRSSLSSKEILNTSNKIDDLFIENEINLLGRLDKKRRLGGILGHLNPTFFIIKIIGVFTIILGLLGLIIVLNLTIQERTREIGVKKSLGATFNKIFTFFLIEFVLLSIISIIIGSILAIPLSKMLNGVISEVIIRQHEVAFQPDYLIMIFVILILLILQSGIISLNSRFKIKKNVRNLIDYNF